jgi:hypothetical protein
VEEKKRDCPSQFQMALTLTQDDEFAFEISLYYFISCDSVEMSIGTKISSNPSHKNGDEIPRALFVFCS